MEPGDKRHQAQQDGGGVHRLPGFGGRLRPEYYAVLVPILFLAAGWLVRMASLIWFNPDEILAQNAVARTLLALATLAMALVPAWALLAVTSRRLHDADMPGLLAALWLVPLPLLWMFLYITGSLIPSSGLPNRHGAPPPKPPAPLRLLPLLPVAALLLSFAAAPVFWIYLAALLVDPGQWGAWGQILTAP